MAPSVLFICMWIFASSTTLSAVLVVAEARVGLVVVALGFVVFPSDFPNLIKWVVEVLDALQFSEVMCKM